MSLRRGPWPNTWVLDGTGLLLGKWRGDPKAWVLQSAPGPVEDAVRRWLADTGLKDISFSSRQDALHAAQANLAVSRPAVPATDLAGDLRLRRVHPGFHESRHGDWTLTRRDPADPTTGKRRHPWVLLSPTGNHYSVASVRQAHERIALLINWRKEPARRDEPT